MGIIYPKVIKLSALIPVVKKVFPNPHGLAVLTDASPVSPFTLGKVLNPTAFRPKFLKSYATEIRLVAALFSFSLYRLPPWSNKSLFLYQKGHIKQLKCYNNVYYVKET